MRLLALAMVLPCVVSAQASVTGFVRDSAGRPIARAEVAIEALSLRTVTDGSGRYLLADVPAGMRLIRVRGIGFQPVAAMVRLESGQAKTHDVILERTPQYLDTVVVRERTKVAGVGLAAFAERQRLGFGKFFDTTFLRKNEHRKLQHFLGEIPGVRIVAPPHCASRDCWQPPTTMRVAFGRRMGTDCAMLVILDGVALSNATGSWEGAFDLNAMPLSNLAAVEVYRSAAEIPGEFNGPRSQCGVLVLWTRREP